jgi:MFS transporter, PAT family, beta-lactamase induction signal transducer AmpG
VTSMLQSSGTGFMAQSIGWSAFFVATALAVLPVLAWLQRRRHFASLEAKRDA